MSAYDAAQPSASLTRRPSLFLRSRPKTACHDQSKTTRRRASVFDFSSSAAHDSASGSSQETDQGYINASPKRSASKSFSSSLRHGFSDLARRMSTRRKSVPFRPKTSHDHDQPLESDEHLDVPALRSKASWLRRPSLNLLNHRYVDEALQEESDFGGNESDQYLLPPVPGSAARAAAAAQNELLRKDRNALNLELPRLHEFRITRDSESGIGIVLRDQSETRSARGNFVRRDPADALPAELMAQVLSYLDPKSLLKAEQVSHLWQAAATSRHVWRPVFRQHYGSKLTQTKNASGRIYAAGLGKTLPDQDWKRMYRVRKQLEERWKKGQAAAIRLVGHKDSVYCVQFDEHKIITGSRDRTIRIWSTKYPWPCLKVIGSPSALSAAGAANNTIDQVSPPTGTGPFVSINPHTLPSQNVTTHFSPSDCHQASILCLQFDEEILVTGSSDHTCIVWDIQNDYKPIRRLRGHTAGVLDVCFDDKYIVSCSKDTSICIWDRATGNLVKRLLGHVGPVNAVQLRGNLIVSASGDGVAKLWNLSSGNCIREFPSKDRGLACVEFSEDARTILAGGNDQVIYQFDANTGELRRELQGHTGLVRSLHLDGPSNRVVSGSYDMSVKVFDLESGELSINLPGWTTSWMLSAKSDYRRIVATSQDSRAVIMDFGYGVEGIEMLES